jgi:hypothetical protein
MIQAIRKLGIAVLAAIVATSCGGGGGGGSSSGSGGGGSNRITFTPDRTSVSLSYSEGEPATSGATVNVTAVGTFNGTLYIGATVEGQGIDPIINATITGTSARFDLMPRTGLAAGTYTGRVLLLGCSDAACNSQIGNSPVAVSYTVTVLPTLRVTPANVDASSPSGTAITRDVQVRLPSGATSFSAVVTQGADWMSVDQITTAGFRLNLRSLPMSNYTGQVLVTSGASVYSLPVAYAVTAGVPYRALSASPAGFSVSGTEGVSNAPVTLEVTPPSWDPATSASLMGAAAGSWLSIVPAANGYTLVVDATDLTAGTYSASVLVTGGYPAEPVVVPFALTVGPGFRQPADIVKTIDAETTAAELAGTTSVEINAGPPTGWTATSDAAWLQLTDTSGTSGETLSYQIDQAALMALENVREHVARVTITPQRPTMSPVTYAVRIHKRIAQVSTVSPYIQPAGRALRVILRGAGFDGVTDLAARVHIAGGSVAAVTRVNDTEVILAVDPLSAGDHAVTIDNALGFATGTRSLKVFTPTVLTYATMPTGGVPRGLFWDQERNAAYLVNVTLESLQQMKFASGWSTSSTAVPAILSAGLTQDGSRLLVASSAPGISRIRQLDANTLTEITSQDVPGLYRGFTYITGEILTTNDARSWFATGSTWNNLAYFDAATETIHAVNPGVQTSFHGGPWFGMSRDGERLIIPQSGSISPAPLGLYMDSADSVVRENPAGLTFTYRMSLSEDGDRMLFDNYEVRDRGYALVGRVIFPTAWQYFPISGVVSPDGRRVYMVAYHNSYGPGNPVTPRLYVLDSSTRQTTQEALPVIGYTDIPDYPTCVDWQTNFNCVTVVHTAISPDGGNLFIAGAARFIAMPIPAESALSPAKATRTPGSGIVTTPWTLNLR